MYKITHEFCSDITKVHMCQFFSFFNFMA